MNSIHLLEKLIIEKLLLQRTLCCQVTYDPNNGALHVHHNKMLFVYGFWITYYLMWRALNIL